MPSHDPRETTDDERPSRSARRRDAQGVLAFARQLSELPRARIDKLELPDDVHEEIAELQRTPSHIAHKRQLAHLAKLMRAHGDETFAFARNALAGDRSAGAREAAALHQVEALRERLLAGGDTALDELITAFPDADRQHLRALIRQGRRERETDKPPRAQRELFRALRGLEKDNGIATTD